MSYHGERWGWGRVGDVVRAGVKALHWGVLGPQNRTIKIHRTRDNVTGLKVGPNSKSKSLNARPRQQYSPDTYTATAGRESQDGVVFNSGKSPNNLKFDIPLGKHRTTATQGYEVLHVTNIECCHLPLVSLSTKTETVKHWINNSYWFVNGWTAFVCDNQARTDDCNI